MRDWGSKGWARCTERARLGARFVRASVGWIDLSGARLLGLRLAFIGSVQSNQFSAHPTQLTSAAESSCAKAHDTIACPFGIETEVSPSIAHRTLGWKAAADGLPARRYRLRLKKLEREHTPAVDA